MWITLSQDSRKLITIIASQLYLGSEERKFGLFLQQIVDWITVTEEKLLADSLQLDSVVKPEDSISFAGASEP